MPIISGGLGAGGGVQVATKTLTNAQVIALPTTPVQLVAAPGSGTMIVPLHAIAVLHQVQDYGNVDANAQLAVTHGTSSGPSLLNFSREPTTHGGLDYLLAPGGDSGVMVFAAATLANTPGNPFDAYGPGESVATFYDNAALNLVVNNQASGNFNGGDSGNSLKVSVTYYTMTLP